MLLWLLPGGGLYPVSLETKLRGVARGFVRDVLTIEIHGSQVRLGLSEIGRQKRGKKTVSRAAMEAQSIWVKARHGLPWRITDTSGSKGQQQVAPTSHLPDIDRYIIIYTYNVYIYTYNVYIYIYI